MAEIRKMQERDREVVIGMMRGFYASPCVYTNGSEEIFKADFDGCISDSPYIDGYVFESNGKIVGYGMLAKSFSTEFGRECIWIEDLFISEDYRGLGIGSSFFKFVEESYPGAIFRLEVEEENLRARSVYEKNGFDYLPYLEMKKIK